ncbi:MAG TPA: PucR family transcriptional regulator ligand-binding domain-containing protein, partial [Fusibacter sp.]|nr:PucR family transcriptional regulator ligand-binding domain-containing protein [Fusibacter sp.]
MELKKLLSQPPFEEAKIIVGHELLERNITSAMVLEAVDIENWGEPNQMILTSYFALKALSNDELDYFFSKMCTIGIGVLVLKLERLLYDVPEILITLSEKYKLPLLTIPKSIRYETILFAVLRPVINHNANLLDTYYQTRQALNKMAQKIPTIEEMLTNFKYLLKLDFQFTMPLKQQTIATNPALMPYKILHSTPILTENFMTFKYVRYQLSYADENKDTPKTAICVDVPNLENQKYLLVVFEQRGFLGELDYMVLENAVEFLQAELLKNYTIRHSQFLKKNDLMVDLLNNRYYSTIEQDEILSLVGLNMFEYYQ